jgi:hypothetical protein
LQNHTDFSHWVAVFPYWTDIVGHIWSPQYNFACRTGSAKSATAIAGNLWRQFNCRKQYCFMLANCTVLHSPVPSSLPLGSHLAIHCRYLDHGLQITMNKFFFWICSKMWRGIHFIAETD